MADIIGQAASFGTNIITGNIGGIASDLFGSSGLLGGISTLWGGHDEPVPPYKSANGKYQLLPNWYYEEAVKTWDQNTADKRDTGKLANQIMVLGRLFASSKGQDIQDGYSWVPKAMIDGAHDIWHSTVGDYDFTDNQGTWERVLKDNPQFVSYWRNVLAKKINPVNTTLDAFKTTYSTASLPETSGFAGGTIKLPAENSQTSATASEVKPMQGNISLFIGIGVAAALILVLMNTKKRK